MGRFKIYDPRKLVSMEKNANYGKCLLCEKKLKIIMGNIKRHYEQMHSVYVDANAKQSKRSKKRRSKVKKLSNDNESNEISSQMQTLNDGEIHKNKKMQSLTSPICTYQNNNFTSNLTESSTKATEKTAKEFESNAKENGQLNKTSTTNQQTQLVNLSLPAPLIGNPHIIQNDQIPKIQFEQQLPTQHSNLKPPRLVEESDEIQIPCYSFINNIKINSAESCPQLEFLKCLVETKAHVNIPLKTFQNEGTFQKALQNWKPSFQFNYSPQTIGDHIDRMTKTLQQKIKQMVAHRLVYLKLDITNNTNGYIMLINIQFINDFQFQVITLNSLELSDAELATYLKKKVLSTLARFNIQIFNVFSIIKDNTNNVRKDLNKCEKICEHSTNTQYCLNLTSGFTGHAIHFVASDIIEQLNENISQSRDSVRRLQRQMHKHKTKSTLLLDDNANWFSVYDMIESLINVCNEIENKNIFLIEVDLVFAKKFVESFKPIMDTAIMLQTNDIVLMGDFYREWLYCELQLKEIALSNEVSLYLLEALHKRRLEFFENSSFLAALYLDHRFCYMGSIYLNAKQKEVAIDQLLQIFNKLKAMPENANILDMNSNDRYDMLEQQVITNIETTHSCQPIAFKDINEVRVKEYLKQFEFEARLPFKTNILAYWNMVQYKNPILAKIAETALAAPATQSTLNRALNTTSKTLLKRKLNENTENIDNLLLLKLNEDLVDKISLEN